MASLKAELRALLSREREEVAKAKAERQAANAELTKKQMAIFHARQLDGLTQSGSGNYKVEPLWPNYNRKDKRMIIRKSEIYEFLSELGVPVELSEKCSWGTLTNVYGALMIGLYGAGWIDGIDQSLDRGFFSLNKRM